MLEIVHMTVNGEEKELAVDPRESLLDTLRNRLNLTSVKRGTMWAEGKHILTVEGLKSPTGELNEVQQAFIDEAAVQCGFCTPGLILTGVELVNSGRKYTREELRKLISGHLCRCTGYENILNALEKVVGYH